MSLVFTGNFSQAGWSNTHGFTTVSMLMGVFCCACVFFTQHEGTVGGQAAGLCVNTFQKLGCTVTKNECTCKNRLSFDCDDTDERISD